MYANTVVYDEKCVDWDTEAGDQPTLIDAPRLHRLTYKLQ